MNYPESDFMKALHAQENRLSATNWTSTTDWSFVGANEDGTVNGTSAIDQGNHADHKYRYLNGNDPEVTHSGSECQRRPVARHHERMGTTGNRVPRHCRRQVVTRKENR